MPPTLERVSFNPFVVRGRNSNAAPAGKLFHSTLRKCRNYAQELPSLLLFSFPQCTFTSYSPRSHQAFYSELPENICGFHAAPGAPGIQLCEVCALRLGLSGSSVGPPAFMPLNQCKTPASSLLYSAFAFLSSSLFRPPSLGHWCQTDLLCTGVRFCSPSPMCI